MKVLTLTEYVNRKLETDEEFSKHYAREKIINDIAEMVVTARKIENLTQSELARKVGTTQSVISRIESGKSVYIPSLETLLKIASALNMKLRLHLS